jgi:hypothetical protein
MKYSITDVVPDSIKINTSSIIYITNKILYPTDEYVPNITHVHPNSNDPNIIYEPNIERMIRIENTQNSNNMTNIENNQIQNNGFISRCKKYCRRCCCGIYCGIYCSIVGVIVSVGSLMIIMFIFEIYILKYTQIYTKQYNNMTNNITNNELM